MNGFTCKLIEQGARQGSCSTFYRRGKGYFSDFREDRACKVTLKWEGNVPNRKITSVLLSRPEDYLSIYQSGCNLSCQKCHSWEFSQYKTGDWFSPEEIAKAAEEYARQVTVWEPKERATSAHASDLCSHCGHCITEERPSSRCPQKLQPEQILFSPQGFGPARNIVAFTGGDLLCSPEWYGQSAEKIKEKNLDLRVLLETNGYGLTSQNLDYLKGSGVDSFWLDIKAWDDEIHKKLTGVDNRWILGLPEELVKRGFGLEVLTLYIPGWVEADQIKRIAGLVASANKETYFTILAFFGQYKLKNVPSPNLEQMLEAYQVSREAGLQNVRLGNLGIFLKSQKDYERYQKHIH